MGIWLQRALRAGRRPPGEIMRRLVQEAVAWPDRYRAPPADKLTGAAFARLFGAADIDIDKASAGDPLRIDGSRAGHGFDDIFNGLANRTDAL